MDFSSLFSGFDSQSVIQALSTQTTYLQLAVVFLSLGISFVISIFIGRQLQAIKKRKLFIKVRILSNVVTALDSLLQPLLNVFFLIMMAQVSLDVLETNWLVRIAEGFAIVYLLYSFAIRFIDNPFIKIFIKWIIIPLALLEVMDLLTPIITYTEKVSIEAGSIKISAYSIARLIIFGVFLFWMGKVSNTIGQQIIRSQQNFDTTTREIFAKLFEVFLFAVIFFIMLQLLGISLTTLTVFGGALGVGLGFGLQSIASNFISGIIILLDRSVTVGDYIELEDGRAGHIRLLNMRSAILETYDGKDIMVPNEQFITTNFVNWTHKNKKQRYPIEISVAYDTDLDKLFPLLREVVSSHPDVLSGDDLPIEEQPDAEIASFGDSGINILIEFWIEGIDDGENRIGADLNYLIWKALKENNISIPFPQREIKILNQ